MALKMRKNPATTLNGMAFKCLSAAVIPNRARGELPQHLKQKCLVYQGQFTRVGEAPAQLLETTRILFIYNFINGLERADK